MPLVRFEPAHCYQESGTLPTELTLLPKLHKFCTYGVNNGTSYAQSVPCCPVVGVDIEVSCIQGSLAKTEQQCPVGLFSDGCLQPCP